jgi:hypothetical protein
VPARPSQATRDGSGTGAGRPADDAEKSGGAMTGGLAGQRSQQITPPWASPDWQSDQRAAGEALDAGAVPDRYRDVVRAYFQLEPGDEPR